MGRDTLKPGDDGDHITYCRMCNALCGMVATIQDGVIVKMAPDRENPASQGHICVKGPAIATITQDPDRVLYPLKRVGGPGEFVEVSWDEALDDIATRLRATVDENGANAFAYYQGNPVGYSWIFSYSQQFGATVGSDRYYSGVALDIASPMAASELVWGNPWTFMFPDLPSNDLLLVFGSNLLVSQGTVLTNPRVRDDLNAIARRGRVIVIDPRRTETARTYEHLPIRPDSDIYLMCAMINVMAEEGLLDDELIAAHTSGAAEFLKASSMVTLEAAAERTGISAEIILDLARTFANTPNAAAYSRLGICRGSFPTLSNVVVDMLNVLSGKMGGGGGMVFGYSPAPHEGAFNVGATRTIGTLRTRVGNLPSVSGHLPSSALAADILEPGAGQIRSLMVLAGNPVLSSPRGDELEKALDSLDLFFSIDVYVTETNRFAHYILPSTTFIERDDLQMSFCAHMVRPHIQYTRAVSEPLGQARPETEIMNEISKRAGFGTIFGTDPDTGAEIGIRDVVDDKLRNSDIGDGFGARPGGLSIQRLDEEYPHGMMIKGRYPRQDWTAKISTDDGRIHCWGPEIEAEFGRLDAQVGQPVPDLLLFGLRDLKHLNSWTHNAERLVRTSKPALLIHPDDAGPRNLVTGCRARLASASGEIEVDVKVTDEVVPGSVCYPHGWGHRGGGWQRANAVGGSNINLLASSRAEDQESLSGMAKLEGIPVVVRVLQTP